MLVYRVEHHETGAGPFQSEFYLEDTGYSVSPDDWGKYLPYSEHYNNSEGEHHFEPNMRRWACPDAKHIRAMCAREGALLSDFGWCVTVYNVPEEYVFTGDSGKQVIINFAHAFLVRVLELIEFLLGKEVQYAA